MALRRFVCHSVAEYTMALYDRHERRGAPGDPRDPKAEHRTATGHPCTEEAGTLSAKSNRGRREGSPV